MAKRGGLQDSYTVLNTVYAVRTELNAAQLKEKAVAAVEKAVSDRKIAPASKDAYLAMCATQEGLSTFSKIMERSRALLHRLTDTTEIRPLHVCLSQTCDKTHFSE